mmetsp:Transcript_23835/g.3963  ORF Transcript_23835/g.3963 Transcript_23835/m.3963 type:complete len:82 (-) Transcript_23835:592-837(-)
MMCDGILGLSFSELSDDKDTLIDSLYKQGYIESRVFSVYLSDNWELGTDTSSNIILGGSDPETFGEGDKITYLKVFKETGY